MKGVGKFRDREYDSQHGDGAHALASKGSCIAALRPTTS